MPNLVHLHLLLNHWPIIGTFIATGLLIVARVAKSDHLTEATLALFALLALLSIPTYLTGNLAQLLMENEEGIARALIVTHQGAALLAFVALEITGGLSWAGLWQFRRRSSVARWTMWSILACAMVTIALITVTGTTGGAIRHPEILSADEPASVVGSLGIRVFDGVQYFVTGYSKWVWPFVETLHFIGLALLLGATGVLNLRLLGFLRQLPAGPLHRLIPWGFAGLALNVVTGMLFFVGMPAFYVFNIDFHFKIVALVLAGATLVLHTTSAFRGCEQIAAGEDTPAAARFLAAASTVLWIAVIVFGRYMPMFEDTLDPRF
jgi:hypothetical protein